MRNPVQGRSRFVVDHDQFRDLDGILVDQRLHRRAAQIHERLRLGQQHFRVRRSCPRRSAPSNPVRVTRMPLSLGQPVDREKPKIVRRALVLRAGIAQTDDKPGHGRLLLLLVVLLLRGRSLFLLALLDDFGLGRRCGFRRYFFGSLRRRPRARSPRRPGSSAASNRSAESPKRGCSGRSTSSVTSTVNASGISSGRHSISISRVMISCRSALHLDAVGIAVRVHRHLDDHLLGEIDPLQIDVQQARLDRIVLPIDDHDGRLRALDIDVEDRVVARRALQNPVTSFGLTAIATGSVPSP